MLRICVVRRVVRQFGRARLVRTLSQSSSTTSVQREGKESPSVPDFENTKVAFASKSTSDLLRSIFVLAACQESLVSRAEYLLGLSTRLLGDTVTTALIRRTFFKHFCAGETEDEALTTTKALSEYGMGGILDFAAEGDLSNGKTDVVTREYEYESERMCDVHMLNFEKSVSAAGRGGFAAVKMTALGDAETLERLSRCVNQIRDLFVKMFSDAKELEAEDESERLLKLRRMNSSPRLPSRKTFEKAFELHFKDESGADVYDAVIAHARERFHDDEASRDSEIDLMEWFSFVTPEEYVELGKKLRNPHFSFEWTLDDTEKMNRMMGRLERIAQKASDLGVRIMIDAEQSYFQPAIDRLTLEAMRKHNVDPLKGPVVFATYQAYLKDANDRLSYGLKLSKREQWIFAAKVVRGAYMVRERALAEEQCRPSPVHDTLEETATSYDQCCKLILENEEKAHLVVASHNRDSCVNVIKTMQELGLPKHSVSFAQLYGMADVLSFSLAANGYPVFKYLPFGPVDQVLPYLVRRAQENSSVAEGAQQEIKDNLRELRRRLFG